LALLVLPIVVLLFLQAPSRSRLASATSAIAVLGLGFLLSLTGGVWLVVAVYSAAIAAELRPHRLAGGLIILLTAASGVFGLIRHEPLLFVSIGLFMMLLVGFENVSRVRLRDKSEALAAAHGEVRRLAAAAERERIGRDLHDLLGRTLTLVSIKAELASRLASRDAASAEKEMSQVAEAARAALTEMRAAVIGMTTGGLERELEASRQALAAAGVSSEVEGDVEQVPADAGAVLAMILREAVTNVIRHSGARRCTIALRSDANEVCLTVADDGCGITGATGAGLAGVRARVEAAGGKFTLDAGPGVRIVASLPGRAGK
jgi:two-component system sensor histidine kinase DesK